MTEVEIPDWGFWVGINWNRGTICTTSGVMTKAEFMDAKEIEDERDVAGPYKSLPEVWSMQGRINKFFKGWAGDKRFEKMANVNTLQDLIEQGLV